MDIQNMLILTSMNKKTCLTLISLFLSLFSFSQTLLLKDAELNDPVANVAIYNQDRTKSALSNSKGEVSLDIFSVSEMIYLQHPSYKKIQFTKSSVGGLVIYLEKNCC